MATTPDAPSRCAVRRTTRRWRATDRLVSVGLGAIALTTAIALGISAPAVSPVSAGIAAAPAAVVVPDGPDAQPPARLTDGHRLFDGGPHRGGGR